MSQTETCPGCGRELRGVIESTVKEIGQMVFVISKETPDCNWTRCKFCRKVMCKTCFQAEQSVHAGKCAEMISSRESTSAQTKTQTTINRR
jgi:hypothetical protein